MPYTIALGATANNTHLEGGPLVEEDSPWDPVNFPWEISPNQFDFQHAKHVGAGQIGDVYKMEVNGVTFAVKKLFPEIQHNDKAIKYFQEEVKRMKDLRHPNIVPVLSVCTVPGSLMYVQPWFHQGGVEESGVPRGSLRTLPRSQILHCLVSIAKGMAFLHGTPPNPIIHRHLKPRNILLSDDHQLAVSDYGFSKILQFGNPEEHTTRKYTDPALYKYTAPEITLGEPYTSKVDVYSFGILINELIEGMAVGGVDDPLWRNPELTAMNAARAGLRPNWNEFKYPRGAIDLMKECWSANPSDRPTFKEVARRLEQILEVFVQEHGHEEQQKCAVM